eukprot:Nitzschia sp. Nitz4//scaffold39_size137210//84311//85720//NITZ4_003209-RA/size137210-processed-gene-0.120-mRNA-1//-1//CDS//3329550413//6439//frame0
MYSRWGDAELLGLSGQMTGAARLNSATGRMSEAAALSSALTPSELANLTNSAALRQHQAAVAAHYGLAPASAIHGSVQLVSAPGGGYQAVVAAPSASGQVPMASRLLYGATAAESALLRRTQAEKYAQQQQTAQVYRDQASHEPPPSHAPPSSREGRRMAQQEEEHLVKSVRHELDRKLKSKPHQVIEIVDDDEEEEEESERHFKSSRSSSSKKKRRHMSESPDIGSVHKKRKHKEKRERATVSHKESPAARAPIPASPVTMPYVHPSVANLVHNLPVPYPPNQPQKLSHSQTIQGFLKSQLMHQVVKNDAERSAKLINSVVELARGASPQGTRYAPSTLEVSVPTLKQIVSLVEGDVYRHLSQSLDRVFDKADAEKIFDVPEQKASPAPTQPAESQTPPQVDTAAAAEIASLRREVASLKSHLAQLKVNHSRSIRAYMRASVDSLRAYRKSVEEEVTEVSPEAVEDQQ